MPEARALRGWLQRAWYGQRPPLLLRPLAGLYRLVLALHALPYRAGWRRPAHPGVPTVVIGNVTVGGTGKTPLAIWLARTLIEHGRRPGLVLRGHGGRQRDARQLRGNEDPAAVGDEAVLLARRTGCPVAVGARRVEAARLLVATGCDIVIADDGLQHRGLAADLAVLVIDGARGFGNGALLPAGPLRTAGSPWRAQQLVVVHGRDERGVVPASEQPLTMNLTPLALCELASGAERPLTLLRGATVHAVAGIGHPERFFALLRTLGANCIEHPLPDHHAYAAGDLPRPDGHMIVMTEKDAVKCRLLAGPRDDVFYVPVSAVLPPLDAARLLARALSIGRG